MPKRNVWMAPHNTRDPSAVYYFKNNVYLNVTNRCTNDCYFCLRKFKSGIAGYNLRLRDEPSSSFLIEELKSMLCRRSCSEIVFCGFGEPTLRLETVLEVAAWIDRKALKPIRIDTNGHALLLYPDRNVAEELKDAGVGKLSVSLNADTKSIYNEVCRPRFPNAFEKALELVRCSVDMGLDTEITAVAIPEINISRVRELAMDLGAKFRARPYLAFIW